MTHDLRRLRLAGLIARVEQTNRHVLTPTASREASTPRCATGRLLHPS